MKQFSTQIVGYTVTNDNYIDIAKLISSKYGCCPALNDIVMTAVSNDETIVCSRKGLNDGINKHIKLIGYTPTYFNSVMRSIGSEY